MVMGTPQMRAKMSIPSITVNGVIVPKLNEPVRNLGAVFDPNINMSVYYQKLSSLQITTFETMEK